jgi:hypothetical protein
MLIFYTNCSNLKLWSAVKANDRVPCTLHEWQWKYEWSAEYSLEITVSGDVTPYGGFKFTIISIEPTDSVFRVPRKMEVADSS